MSVLSRRRRAGMGVLVLAIPMAVAAIQAAPATAAPTCARVPSDFDGDSYADLVIGEPGRGDDDFPSFYQGAIRVVYGSSTGLGGTARSQLINEESPGMPPGGGGGIALGSAAAAGYFNDDCYADVAVGASRGARMWIFYGSPTGLTTAGATRFRDTDLRPPGGTDRTDFGHAVAAGDFNGDGRDDVAVGAPLTDGAHGAVAVLYGTPTGITTAGAAWLTQDSPGVPSAGEPEDRFGEALAGGDVNGDGRAELVVGVGGETTNGVAHSGALAVVPGTAAGLTGLGTQWWDQNSAGVPDANEPEDAFGRSLAVGDVDGDGRADLAVGVLGETVGTVRLAGSVMILRGGTAGLTATGAQQWHQNTSGVPDAAEYLDLFGTALGWGDFNRDGRGDLAVGAPNEGVGTQNQAGSVTVLYGRPTGLTATGAQLFTQNTTGVPSTAEATDYFGYAVRSVRGPGGYHGLAVGTPYESAAPNYEDGLVILIPGGATGLTGTGSRAWSGQNLDGGARGEAFLGTSLG